MGKFLNALGYDFGASAEVGPSFFAQYDRSGAISTLPVPPFYIFSQYREGGGVGRGDVEHKRKQTRLLRSVL